MKKQFQICLLVLSFISISAVVCNAQSGENISVNSGNKKTLKSKVNSTGKNISLNLTEPDAIVQTDFTGFEPNSLYGNSVKGAGDLNGDGLSDFIIGAQNYNSGQGRAYIYFGKIVMTNVPDLILTGQNIFDYFAASVSGAGDVNGDGYSDVIVGAPGYNGSAGKTYIYFGGSAMNNTADVTISGITSGDNFGNSVAEAGDVNGDGYSDVIVSAYYFNNLTGRSYIYFGGAIMNNISDVILTGESPGDEFGVSAVCAGDVNGDGYSDIITGADGKNSGTGRAYVFFGGNPMNSTADLIINGGSFYDGFAHSVSGAGDINGDGYSDFIIGASGCDSGGVNSGRAYIYYGGAAVNNIPDFIFTGSTNNYLGGNVSNGGDVNGDGYSDFLISSTGENNYTGTVYIILGGTTITNYIILNGANSGDFFGSSISGCGDINGDGNSDVLAGSPYYNSNTGKVYLYMKSVSVSSKPDLTFTGAGGNTNFGSSASPAGDLNGDGYPDFIAGSPLGYSNRGIAFIFFGGPAMDTVDDVTLFGDGYGNNFGSSVSAAGDVNGDGFGDVIVGAYAFNSGKGIAYIFYGGISMDNVPDVILNGEFDGDYFGSSVSNAGDVNSDGYSDVIVGANGYNSNTGKAYIFLGGASMNNTPDVIFSGEAFLNYFGRSVSGAGDVNSDGYSDVIVGADGYNSDAGRAYIYFGNNIMDNIADVILTGESAQNNFGHSVSIAGDVNKDGYSDVIVGANWYGSHKGRAYVFYGGAPMNNVSDVVITGESPQEELGRSVSGAGDLNNDGYADVIIGAPGYNFATGSALIFYGGTNMNNIEDITLTGESALNYFGTSVSGAVDLNNDGFSDLLVGADGYFHNTGRVYSYLSPSKNIEINLTALLQGFYDQITNTQVSDTIKVLLRTTSAPFAIADSAKAVLSPGGKASVKFKNAPSGNYYLVIRHRNSIETWSRNNGEILAKGSLYSYSFTNSASQAFGNNLALKGIRYCIYSGDVNQEGHIDLTDLLVINNDATNFVTGYKASDVNGNNITDLRDLIIAYNNSVNFTGVVRP